MELAKWLIVFALGSTGVGLIVASILYLRGQMRLYSFGFTLVALFGVAVVGTAEFVDAELVWSAVGVILVVFAGYKLEQTRSVSSSTPSQSLDPIQPGRRI